MTITLEIRTMGGVKRFYPLDENASRFTQLTKTQSLTKAMIHVIEGLGFEVEYKEDPTSYVNQAFNNKGRL